jgi:hypothetical protein
MTEPRSDSTWREAFESVAETGGQLTLWAAELADRGALAGDHADRLEAAEQTARAAVDDLQRARRNP